MKILITEICGFVGSTLARTLFKSWDNLQIIGVDNFIRPGSELSRRELAKLGVKIFDADVRTATDFEALPAVDCVVDVAANSSVLAGVNGKTSLQQLLDHNVRDKVNILEYCETNRTGLVLLSTSRVYSVPPLAGQPAEAHQHAFRPLTGAKLPDGLSAAGVNEKFSATPPISPYSSSKLANEAVALEYAEMFNFSVWINRYNVLPGTSQFGKTNQGGGWINVHSRFRPLKYIGLDSAGHQVRDGLHPRDLVPALQAQMQYHGKGKPRIVISMAAQPAPCLSHSSPTGVTNTLVSMPWLVMPIRARSISRGWCWTPRSPRSTGTGRQKPPCRRCWRKSRNTPNKALNGWKFPHRKQ